MINSGARLTSNLKSVADLSRVKERFCFVLEYCLFLCAALHQKFEHCFVICAMFHNVSTSRWLLVVEQIGLSVYLSFNTEMSCDVANNSVMTALWTEFRY